jgi:translocation and assembly module TamB
VTRTRRLAVLWVAFLLVLLPSLFLWMLLGTAMGLRYALKQAADALPGGEVSYSSVQGSLWRGAHIEGLRLAGEDFEVEVGQLRIEADLGRLLRRELRVIDLEATMVRLALPPGDGAAAGGEVFPLQLPALQLPVALVVERLRIDDLMVVTAGDTLAAIAALEARVSLDDGLLLLDRLTLVESRGRLDVSGRVDTQRRYLTELVIGLTPDAPEWATEITIAGDLRMLALRSEGAEALPLTLDLEALDLDRAQPRWRADLRGQGIDPGTWLEPWRQGALDLDLRVEGGLQQLDLGGQAQWAGRDIRLESLQLQRTGARIDFDNLLLREGTQSLRGHGHVLLTPTPSARVELDFSDLALPPEAPRARASGHLLADGSPDAWSLTLGSDLVVDGEASRIELTGHGDPQGFRIDTLEATTGLGRLHAAGRIDWVEGLAWRLDGEASQFQPERLGLPLQGSLDLRLSSHGRWGPDGPEGELLLDPIAGSLGGSALAGRARMEAEGMQRWQVEATLAVGEGRLAIDAHAADGAIDGSLDLQAFDPAMLGLPASLLASGTLRLGGRVEAPTLAIDMSLARVRAAGLTAATARIVGRIEDDAAMDLVLTMQQADVDGLRLDSVEIHSSGRLQDHQIEARLEGAPGSFELLAQGGLDDGDWRGQLRRLQAEVVHAGPWQLEAPVALEAGASGIAVERACLSSDTRGRLCAQARLPAAGDAQVEVELEALTLALFSPFLFSDGFRRMDGLAEGRIEATREGEAWRGEAALAIPALMLFLDPAGDDDSFLRINDVRLDAVATASEASARLEADIGEDGRLDGALVASPAGETWALDGRLDLRVAASGLEALLHDLDSVEGRIEVDASVGGTLAEPAFDARARVTGFATEIAAAGIRVSEGEFSAATESAQRLALRGSLRSGPGSLALEGHYDIAAQALDLRLEGENFVAAALPQAQVTVSPKLSLVYREGAARVAGSVAVPTALIDISRFEGTDRPSRDVVILEGGREPETTERLPLTARVTVSLGEHVRLKGFGLDGRLGGALTVRETPGQATTGQGAIEVSGRFAAYGRQLDIQRGRLLFSGALDNPLLDVRAERAIEEVTVGVQASGEALAPQLTLYSRPTMAQSDILAYLVAGRPLAAVRGGEGDMLSDAATALGTAGGDLLARQLGARMGLDLGVEASSELGAALTVGRYLSPRLYVGYGVSLFGTGQAVILRYLISEAWSVEVESGSESKAAINYRLER